jgi:hypothetical protein
MSLVVTGATGHFGRLVVENLLERGIPADQIVAGGRSLDRLAPLAERGVQVRRLARVSKDLEVSLSFPQVQAFSIFFWPSYLRPLRGAYRCRSKISKSRCWWGVILVV